MGYDEARMAPESAWSDLGQLHKLASCIFYGRRTQPTPSFETWAAAVTQEQILELFLKRLEERIQYNIPSESVSDAEITYFDNIVFKITSDNAVIPISSIIEHLISNHLELGPLIQLASGALSKLLISYATYPFTAQPSSSPYPSLTRAALIRAVVLLTSKSARLWLWHECPLEHQSKQDFRRKRTEFLFASLACELPRKASIDDILHVLCRVHYPQVYFKPGESYLSRKPEDLIPVAQRLFEQGEADVWEAEDCLLNVADLKPLAELVVALVGRVDEKAFEGKQTLTVEEFWTWAEDVDLQLALDRLLMCFLNSSWPESDAESEDGWESE